MQKKKWVSTLFCLLILLQEFSIITRGCNHALPSSIDNGFKDFKDNDLISKYFTKYMLTNESEDQHQQHREKRSLAAVLFAISLIATLANIGFDIYLEAKGCCGLPCCAVACDYRDEFKKLKTDIEKDVNQMNDEYTVAENILEFIKSMNKLNGDIWWEVARIMKLQERIIQRLDSLIFKKLEIVSMRLKNALLEHNQTVAKYNDYEVIVEYNGLFKDAKTAMEGLAPILGVAAFDGIIKGYKYYKTVKAANALKNGASHMKNIKNLKVQRVMGIKDVKTFARVTVKAQGKAASAATKSARMARFAKGVVSVLSIGLEIWAAIQKVDACKSIRDQAKKAVDTIRPEYAKIKLTKTELGELHKKVTSVYGETKGQLTSEKIMGYYLVLENIAKSSDSAPKYLKQAAKNIRKFHDQIKTANQIATFNLQKILVAALKKLTYTYQCYHNKINTVTYVYDKCKAGLGSIKQTFDYAAKLYEVNADDCTLATGEKYTTFGKTNKYVSDRLKNENMQAECILNNIEMFKITCLKYVEGYSNTNIIKETGLNLNQVKFFVKKCPPGDVSPKVKSIICSTKYAKNLKDTQSQFNKYNQKQVTDAYNACPQPPMEKYIRSIICNDKLSKKKSINQVLKRLDQYDVNAVRFVYNSCQWPKVDADVKRVICLVKNNGQPITLIIDSYSKYKEADLRAAWDNC